MFIPDFLLGRSGYDIPYSAEFGSGDYMYRTNTINPNDQTRGTVSLFYCPMLASMAANAYIMSVSGVTGQSFDIYVAASTNELKLLIGTTTYSTGVYLTDWESFYHIVVAVDTNLETSISRLKVWVDGTQVSAIWTGPTRYATAFYASQNGATINIGRYLTQASGYMWANISDLHIVDGVALNPSYFLDGSGTPIEPLEWPNPGTASFGDRTGTITGSNSASMFAATSQDCNALLDGASLQDCWFAAGDPAGLSMVFQFATASQILGAKLAQSGAYVHGTWKWQGSNNGADYVDLCDQFTMGGAASAELGDLSRNDETYLYYKLLGISGTRSNTPWLYEINFTTPGVFQYGVNGSFCDFLLSPGMGTDVSGSSNDFTESGFGITRSTFTPTS